MNLRNYHSKGYSFGTMISGLYSGYQIEILVEFDKIGYFLI